MAQIAVLTLATDHVKTLVSERAVVGGIAWDPSDDNIVFGAIHRFFKTVADFRVSWNAASLGSRGGRLGASGSEKTHRLTYAQGAGDTNLADSLR